MDDIKKQNESKIFEIYEREFANRLRELRNKKNLSAREMSIALGQNVNYVNLIENGKRFPSLQGFFLLCEYLEISPSDFFDKENFKSLHNENISIRKDFIELTEKLSNSQILALFQMIKEFI